MPELLHLIQQTNHKLIAGGTDLLPRLRRNTGTDAPALIDLSRFSALSFICQSGKTIEIGALTTHHELANSELLHSCAPALVEAATRIGSEQTRARATLGGNIANASPAADTLPPLLCLNTQVVLTSLEGSRAIPMQDFLAGPGKTLQQADEMISSVRFTLPKHPFSFKFDKLGRRAGMAIAVVSTAALLEYDASGLIRVARIACGSVAPTALRCPNAEAALIGQIPCQEAFLAAATALQADISPISDLRASADYRRHAAGVLLQRVLQQAALPAEGEQA
jgi:CO/xanthine dehydrogenase FAD-binding subunit